EAFHANSGLAVVDPACLGIDSGLADLPCCALCFRPTPDEPGQLDSILRGDLDGLRCWLQDPVAPEPAGSLTRCLPRFRYAVLVLLGREGVVLGDVERDPFRIGAAQAGVPGYTAARPKTRRGLV